ncbi:MAG: AraC family transcriptional regulator, partial [Lachnospiraceae bacterium]|nr:AraC family transcriptional regulator [Lachnospiraceae bacterium]
ELARLMGDNLVPEGQYDVEMIKSYFYSLIEKAMELRDRESDHQSKRILKKALLYIEENFSQETISLNSVAGEVNVSANYFSAIFSQAMQVTFVEYVTGKRMEKAKRLLRQTQMHTSEIASEVGYKDSHYFSFVFKKTQGCTPREYRAGNLS